MARCEYPKPHPAQWPAYPARLCELFKARKRTLDTAKLVFWSGVGIAESQEFARATGRQTLEMILGKAWKRYQGIQAEGGHWPDWPAAITGFWDPAFQACAQYATGEVFFYSTRDVLEDQTRPTCPKCWYRKEKPALIASMNSQDHKVPVGYINTMSDKRDPSSATDNLSLVE
ncbi:hypothetical protein BGZ60DRAFT_534877 [Tricladium varicosporioides]|nr:hypothetical protein BGZ60DRAFT_534877 [Hymenoscyphus varicosporioides]